MRHFSVQGASVFYPAAQEFDGRCPVMQKFDKKRQRSGEKCISQIIIVIVLYWKIFLVVKGNPSDTV